MFNLGDAPVLASPGDTIILSGRGSECKVDRPDRRAWPELIWTHHICENHEALIIWPSSCFVGICNCRPTREPHGWSVDCLEGHLIRQTQTNGG